MDNKRKRSFLDDDSDKRIRKIAKKNTITITEDMSDASSTDGREPQAVSCESLNIPRHGRADSSDQDISSLHNQYVFLLNGLPVNVNIAYGNSLGERTRISHIVMGSDVDRSEEQSESHSDDRNDDAVRTEKPVKRPKIPRRGRADSSDRDISSSHNQYVFLFNGHPVNVKFSYGNSLGERTRIPSVVTGSDVYSSEEQSESDIDPAEEQSESDVCPSEEQGESDVDPSEEQSESDFDPSEEQSDRNDDAIRTEKPARAQGSEKSSSEEEEDEEDDECVELLRLTHKVDNKRKRSFLEDDSDKCIRKIAKKYTMAITEDMSDASSTDGREPQAVSCESLKIPRHGRADSSDRDISNSHNQEALPINGHPVNADYIYSVSSLGEDCAQGSEKSSSEEEDEEDDECVELLCLTHKVRAKSVKRSSGYYPLHRSS